MALLPMDQREGWIWLDGRLVPWREARLHVLSHGLHYASAVFEGERAYDGHVFRLMEHGRRLLHSAEILDLPCPWSADELDEATAEVVAASAIRDGYVRRLVWRGPEQIGVAARAGHAHVAIASWPWPRYFDGEAGLRGLRLQTARWRRPDPATAPTGAKAACLYAIGTLSKHAAERAGFDDALMLDWRGRIAEATGANVFFIRDGVLHTPAVEGFLDGLTRQTVLDLARARGVRVLERTIQPRELGSFEACFVTGTAVEVMPVRRIDEHRFGQHPIATRLSADYQMLVRSTAGTGAPEQPDPLPVHA